MSDESPKTLEDMLAELKRLRAALRRLEKRVEELEIDRTQRENYEMEMKERGTWAE